MPKEYLHSAELRDIMQFGSSSQAVFFKMRVAGVLHIFQFETRQVRGTRLGRPGAAEHAASQAPAAGHEGSGAAGTIDGSLGLC